MLDGRPRSPRGLEALHLGWGAGLAEAEGAPVLVAWSCKLARVDIPGFTSLRERMVTSRASAGVFSATGWSNHVSTDAMRNAFHEAAFSSDAETIGRVMRMAHEAASSESVEVHRVYMLLGDPGLRIRVAKAAPDPAPERSERPAVPSPEPDFPSSAVGCSAGPASASANGAWLLVVLGTFALRRSRRRGVH